MVHSDMFESLHYNYSSSLLPVGLLNVLGHFLRLNDLLLRVCDQVDQVDVECCWLIDSFAGSFCSDFSFI
jgi:hypothetical protein